MPCFYGHPLCFCLWVQDCASPELGCWRLHVALMALLALGLWHWGASECRGCSVHPSSSAVTLWSCLCRTLAMPALPRAALLLLLLLLLCSLLAARAQVNPGKWKLGSSQRLRGWGTASGRPRVRLAPSARFTVWEFSGLPCSACQVVQGGTYHSVPTPPHETTVCSTGAWHCPALHCSMPSGCGGSTAGWSWQRDGKQGQTSGLSAALLAARCEITTPWEWCGCSAAQGMQPTRPSWYFSTPFEAGGWVST